jgi:hypothetical protein
MNVVIGSVERVICVEDMQDRKKLNKIMGVFFCNELVFESRQL